MRCSSRIGVVFLLLGLLQGCAYNSVLLPYPAQLAPLKTALDTPTPQAAIKQVAEGIESKDGLLYASEAGRAAQIAGDFNASKSYYQAAEKGYRQVDEQASVSLSDIGAKGSSLLVNDNVIPYSGAGYERILLHQYQALNYLFGGDPQGALVEVRRSNELQQLEQQRYEAGNKTVQQMANGTVSAEMARLSQHTGNLASSFLNPYSYYVTGLLHELLNEPNDAFIDYRKAALLAPQNPYLQQDLVRLAKQLHMPQHDEFRQRWGDAVMPDAGQGRVVFIVEQGFVPYKDSFSVPFTINGNWQAISLPTYRNYEMPMGAQVEGLGTPLTTAPIANIGALAITALKEQLPWLLTRQVARVYAKSELAHQMEGRNGPNVGSVLVQIFNVVTEQADRRSWLTLPAEAQIAHRYLNAGTYPVKLLHGTTQIQVQQGKTTLVWVIDTGNVTRFYTKLI
ncbi:COG3014 family protein [Shewanella sp. YIC-542]|uniref:COG3014 family protein n=1 Tax=Shewanella mytili TaxID=3377111 RepID=UPI00398E6F19